MSRSEESWQLRIDFISYLCSTLKAVANIKLLVELVLKGKNSSTHIMGNFLMIFRLLFLCFFSLSHVNLILMILVRPHHHGN